jgi:hypothetical protein
MRERKRFSLIFSIIFLEIQQFGNISSPANVPSHTQGSGYAGKKLVCHFFESSASWLCHLEMGDMVEEEALLFHYTTKFVTVLHLKSGSRIRKVSIIRKACLPSIKSSY